MRHDRKKSAIQVDTQSLTMGVTDGGGVRAERDRSSRSPTSVAETARHASPNAATGNLRIASTIVALVGVLCWAYWPVLVEMAKKWWSDPQFSHAMLVPPFALFLAWRQWNPADFVAGKPNLWGLLLLLMGVGIRIAGAHYFVDFFEAFSIIPVVAGTLLFVFGWGAFRRTWPACAFLIFMIPLPFRIETGLSIPLQRLATQGSTFVLQTLGLPAFSEGNIIAIGETRVGVVEACNGLGMFLMFFAVSVGVATIVQRPLWEKILLVLSAVPIAVGANIVRVVMTTLAYQFLSKDLVDSVAHDFAGWLMMPLAILFLMLEMKLFSKAFVEVEDVTSRNPVSLKTLHRNDGSTNRPKPIRNRP